MALLYGNKDIIFGKSLLCWGQKFDRVKKQNFIKIYGSAGCKIKRVIEDFDDIKNIKQMYLSSNPHFNSDDMFDKRPNLIAEPEECSDCPDYRGGGKHIRKKHGHTPDIEYRIDAVKLFACCYIDFDRQKRMPEISLREIELSKEITSTKTN